MNVAKQILLVEDNPADIELAKIALKSLPLNTNLISLGNGVALIDYLKKHSPEPTALILLDLNMPQMNGREVLKILNQNERWRHIPVVVFSSSNNKEDIEKCYELGANAYVPKPFDLEEFTTTIQAIARFWSNYNLQPGLDAVSLPATHS